MLDLTPTDIVQYLDRHVVGQQRAKRAIAISIRNRWRRQAAGPIRLDELATCRYLIGGPRGCGRSRMVEAAAKAVEAPFVRTSLLELAAAGNPQRASERVLESLVESARHQPGELTVDDAIREVEHAGIVLFDDIERWTPAADDAASDTLESAQQAMLSLAAGAFVDTSLGRIHTRDILMFATGSIVAARASDIPLDIQMLFPRRIDLDGLHLADLLALMSDESMSPLTAYLQLLHADGIAVEITRDAIEEIVAQAVDLNRRIEDIGARRLVPLIETVLDDYLFGDTTALPQPAVIDARYVVSRLSEDGDEEDLEDFIL
jgi:ATP-dependent protease HslVU (ClpYQ) ATPase subunit